MGTFFSNGALCRSAGIPEDIVRFVEGLSRARGLAPAKPSRVRMRGSFEEMRDRIERITTFWYQNPDSDVSFKRAWKNIEKAAISREHLIEFFINIPDGPGNVPFLLFPFERNVDVGEERARQLKLLGYVEKIDEFFSDAKINQKSKGLIKRSQSDKNCDSNESYSNSHVKETLKRLKKKSGEGLSKNYKDLRADASATGEAAILAYNEFEEIRSEFVIGLRRLKALIEVLDPSQKMLTKHWKAEDANIKTYYAYLASLNHFLQKPQHSAISIIAYANSDQVLVDRDLIRKSWVRVAEKNVFI